MGEVSVHVTERRIFLLKLLDLFRKGRADKQTAEKGGVLHQRYECFRRILASNDKALGIISDLENIIYQDKPFSIAYVLDRSRNLISEVFSIVEDLNALTETAYPELFDVAEEVSTSVLAELRKKKRIEETPLVLPLERLSLDNIAEVGGKAANLGEIYNRAHLPVPPGFAVTAYACQHFLDRNGLTGLIEERLSDLEVNDTESLMAVSREIQSLIMEALIPADLEQAIQQAVRVLKHKAGSPLRLSVRSSATSEDSEASFAGQHSTVLNVSEENILPAYREVVSSTFNPRAIFYRRAKGFMDQDVIMSVACILMVDAKVSGVLYTVDPNDSRHAVVLISAVWGLAVSLVDGSASNDFYQVDKKTRQMEEAEIAEKASLLRSDVEDGVREEPVQEDLKTRPCLDPYQIEVLVNYALRLEAHYGFSLDIEWAIDRNDRLYILQARPLRRSRDTEEETDRTSGGDAVSAAPTHPVLLKGGSSASDGTAAGRAFVIRSDHNIHHVPEAAIVIARQTSPRYVPLMGRIQAIVTDVGTVTGHMASVAREFRIPALVGTGSGTEVIPHGEEITVDATNRTIYRGRVQSLLKRRKARNPMKGSPIYRTVQAALKRIAPLHLTDLRDDDFRCEGCRTLHDIIRFAHEMAMQEMFRIGHDVESERTAAIPLRVSLPAKILVVDLAGGLSVPTGMREATLDHVVSTPFKALLRGMTHEAVSWTQHGAANWRGLGSVIAESLLRDPFLEGPMGGPSYAVVAAHYLNFSSRLGYHFVTVDTFCGPHVNDNYITFYFKGGAADIARRSRRAHLIAMILRWLGFSIEQKGDMVRAEMKKYQSPVLEQKLDMVGRLLGSVNLLDMALEDDRQVEWYAERFMEGDYTFQAQTAPR
ncbi:MAG: pyruvate, phosphate dikinase [Deltaproteobacteria bacterium]|nr:pyruvate, phosphate dikinase [Deltaproteobacteria bacterium]